MKYLAAILFALAVATAGAQMLTNSLTGEVQEGWPSKVGATYNASQADAQAAGWQEFTAEQYAAREAAAQAQAEAQAYAVVAAAGPTVSALQRNLVLCGYSIPISPAEVMADLMRRDALGELSVEQQLAMPKIFMLHRALTDDAGLSNEQIVAVWNAIKPEE